MRAALAVAALLVAFPAACVQHRAPTPRDPPRRTVMKTDYGVDHDFLELDPVEIAVLQPEGEGKNLFRNHLRDALYRGLIDRNYSPLDPDYVDARPPDLRDPETEVCAVVSTLSSWKRTPDGGLLVSGWVNLLQPSSEGGRALYYMQLIDFSVPPVDGTQEKDGAPEAASRFAEALWSKLPTR